MNKLTIYIDDKQFQAEPGKSILEVCREHDIEILTMCHLKGVNDVGACRLCLVEIEGMSKLLSACTTKITANMVIHTKTERIKKYQRITTELFFAERNHVCAVCVANGTCELQDLGYKVGMDHIRYPFLFPKCEVDTSHPWYVMDQNRCIMCTRCVRVCNEVEGAHNWDVKNRGYQVRIISDFDTPWGESITCTSCGKCLQACPTGALWPKAIVQGQMKKNPEIIDELMERRKMIL
ncbi:bidirectional hydrogenase complex protein HoxU [Chitinophagaceae bacterium LB-8]|uniref:Bidirectional hydrogenase complex protein HoxU n=1 Tax=Paraflavisolibacter caeni TaxID=2982496 RepID=A0A9X2XNU5_9BACT|nr:bidirectional hydrogenase complex protein HoxU [Paraflavisolibacter caeni]MCU7549134.1 bidirectional hydrogenase complex protein HoxU [Paraflavisolibacter caeni]